MITDGELGGDDQVRYVAPKEWVSVLGRARLGTLTVRPAAKPGGKPVTITGRVVKGIAFRLALYANWVDGTEVYPGPALLAVLCEVDYKTVKNAYAVLRQFGLLKQITYARGPRSGRIRTDEYRLTLPHDLYDRLHILDPDAVIVEAERVRAANRGKTPTAKQGNASAYEQLEIEGTGVPPTPELEGTGAPPTEHPERKVGGNGNPPPTELEGT